MGVFKTLLQQVLQGLDSMSNFFSAEWFPLINALLVIAAVIAIYFMFKQAKTEAEKKEIVPETKLGSGSVTDLAWLNQLVNWLHVTWYAQLHTIFDSWIHDLNISLAKQKNKCGILIFGLREGSSPPLIRSLKKLRFCEDSMEANILLETSDFGFFVTIQESEGSKIIASSNYSAVVSNFQCWFLATLRRHNGDLVFQLRSMDKNPICRFVLKPHTRQTLAVTAPETISEALKEAVLQTSLRANVSTWEPFRPSVTEEAPDTAEESCYGDSVDDDNYTDVIEQTPPSRSKVPRSSSDGQVLDTVSVTRVRAHANGSASVPVSRSSTPLTVENRLKDFGATTRPLSGSLGSLSNITRSPSGRGPAKPIRVREKRLAIKVIQITTSTIRVGDEICRFELNSPQQVQETTLTSSHSNPVTFDLSSRSSQLDVVLKSSSEKAGDSPTPRGSITVDSIDMAQPTVTAVPLKVGDNIDGSVQLQFTVMENAVANSGSANRNNITTHEQTSNSPRHRPTTLRKDTNSVGASPGQAETKVTMVTSRTLKSSPTRSTKSSSSAVSENDSEGMTSGISFSPSSVAETVLRDLSSKDKKTAVTRTKIVITSVEQQNSAESAAGDAESLSSVKRDEAADDKKQNLTLGGADGNTDRASLRASNSNISTSLSTSQLSHSDVSSLKDEPQVKAGATTDAQVRRSRSFIFGSKKKKDARQSLHLEGDVTGLHPSDSEPRLKKKSTSMTKLFSRKKKSKKGGDSPTKLDNGGLETTFENGLPDEAGADEASTASKPRRTQSFRRLLQGKKKDNKVS